MKRQELIDQINALLSKYDKNTLEAIYMALTSIESDHIKDLIVRKVSKEQDRSALSLIWELVKLF